MRRLLLVALSVLAVAGVVYWAIDSNGLQRSAVIEDPVKNLDRTGLSVATFAGGCFWCVEAAFEAVPGVRAAVSGYSGGVIKNPTYKMVTRGLTKHAESVQVYYDPTIITYKGLLQVLWRSSDPTDDRGQFSDRGSHYRPIIFYHDKEQQRIAIRARDELSKSGRFSKPIKVEIVAFKAFYPAEAYHQDYYRKNPGYYQIYNIGSGRVDFLTKTWGDDLKVDYAKYRPQ